MEMDSKDKGIYMKVGKVSEAVLKRSVIKQIKTKRAEVISGAGAYEDCAAIELKEDEVFVLSTDPVTGSIHDIGRLSINTISNDIAACGAEAVGVMLSILLPKDFEEGDLKEMMRELEAACQELNIQIMGGHTEVTGAVNQPIVTVTGVGRIKKDRLILVSGARLEDDIVVTKWIGLEGTSIIVNEKRALLEKKFQAPFIKKAAEFNRYLSVAGEAMLAADFGVHAMHDVTEGGIFGALWQMAEASRVGLNVDLKSIPIKQETIEICECFGLNPYELISGGAMLIATERGHDLCRVLMENGIEATVVGKFTAGNDRIITNGDEIRYLEPPKSDEIYKLYCKQKESRVK